MDHKEAIRAEISRLEKLIKDLKQQLLERKETLQKLERDSAAGNPSLRFYGWRPLDAIRVVLKENGTMMHKREIYKVLKAGGITKDRKRAVHNVRISIETNVSLGNLLALNGDFLDLPDRKAAFIEGEVIERPNRALPSPEK